MSGSSGICWHTSPACARYLEHLECQGDASPDQLAAQCYSSKKYAYNLLMILRLAGVVRVVAWQHNRNGAPTPIYRLGPGESKPMPNPETIAERMRRRRKWFVSHYGPEAANKILGTARIPGRIVRDGKTVRTGDHQAHLAGKVSR